mmetsp:Transcript_28650/g.50964  ORF Transcript_28650/g.50964 Transcript_28650/m.50964 type:complete len:121 (-) Transcript_28650:733-1095(-)
MYRCLTRTFAGGAVLSVTPSAAAQLNRMMQSQPPDTIGIRLGVKRRGCSGLAYTMDFAKGRSKLDEVVEAEGVKLVVDSKAVMFVLGTTMDYKTDELREEFVFENPNAKGTCGCGESFNV